MSCSPERISSYRRHFEDSSTFSQQVRVSSPSPTRRETRRASSGYSCRPGAGGLRYESAGRRTVSAARRSRMVGGGVGAGALVCVGPGGETAIDLDVASAENHEFLNTRTSERKEMIVLNDRLAVYIEKVRSLEQQNKLLEAEIEAYQNRFQKPSGLRLLYEEQLRELQRIAEQMRFQRDISLAAKESAAGQLEAMKIKYEEAVELRKKAELEIESFRPDVDHATSSRIALEKKLEQLEVEIEFLKRVHQQEIDELMKQIYAAHAMVESTYTLPDLAAAMKQIQNQYDDIAAKNLQEMDSWYKNKFEDMTKKTSGHVDRLRSFREGITGAKKDIQNKESDLDALRTKNEALEAKIREMQEKYRKELEALQARIEALQLELKSTKEKIALHLREYQDLLNIKMALEIEITTYRKLIEGEDLRLSGMMQTLSLTTCSMSAIGGGMSFGGGSQGGMGGGLIGGSGTGAGGMGSGGMGGGMISGSSAGGVGGRMGAGGPAGRSVGKDVIGSHGLGTGGVGGEIGASVGGVGMVGGSGVGAGGIIGGQGTGPGGVGLGPGGISGVGTGGLGAGSAGSGVGGQGTGPGGAGFGAGGISGVGTGGLGAGSGVGGQGAGLGGAGFGAGGISGVGTGGLGAGSAGVGGQGTGPGGAGFGAGGMGTGVGGSFGAGGDMGLSGGTIGGKNHGVGSGILGGGGTEGVGGDVALSGLGGKGKIAGGVGDTSNAGMRYGSDIYDGNLEAYGDQAVELTERRTVLIRTVKKEGDVVETDHQEQNYTISGAADESEEE
ncbi:glial fibrillary acidic filament-like [Solea senegalensis]|uniref:Glial fibrillary acidic filament-like n=3 Tax=Solea senegalensis TaxID=28829 RepID=A0AAV6PX66_SOLSE|nr:vimentin [Solea senegalensis]KAG7475722.1 glial fibrillary acidic filament-like [Solea senegalensis]